MSLLSSPLTLPCGQVLPNRIAKSAMTEGLSDEYGRATEGHNRLYRAWSEGGTGLLITGNVQIDRRYPERPGNVCIDGPQSGDALRRLAEMASAAQSAPGCRCWAQLGHAGRQCDPTVNLDAVGPSGAEWWSPAKMGTVRPRQLTLHEVADVRERFVHAAKVCEQAGFAGVQLHSAHGYLLSSFLNPRANTRRDDYGGPLENRARLLLETVRAVRRAAGDGFAVGVKINSADFQKGGFTIEECARVAGWLDDAGLDLLELSGGNYENPAMMAGPEAEAALNKSTIIREAYFLKFAKEVRAAVRRTPVMVTGGMRSAAVMDAALRDGDCEVIGVGRPLCGDAGCVGKLLRGEIAALPAYENTLELPALMRWLMWTSLGPKIRFGGQQMWYYQQERNIAAGKGVDAALGIISALMAVPKEDMRQAAALKGLSCVGSITNRKPVSPLRKLLVAVGAALLVYLIARWARR